MRITRVWLLCSFGWLLAVLAPAAHAQVSVSLRVVEQSVLLYEPVVVEVTLRNLSGRSIRLGEDTSRPWLSFLVMDPLGRVLPGLEDRDGREQILLRPGRSIRHTVDLLPAYDIRSPGTYRLQALVESGNTRAQSALERLVVLEGNLLWTQTIGLPVDDAGNNPASGESRTYSLIIKHGERHLQLYCRVVDEQAGLIHAMRHLGSFVPLGEPQAATDRHAHLHLLFRGGPRAFQYREIDPRGELVTQAGYSNLQSDPQLIVEPDGEVRVEGGEQVYPRREPLAGPAADDTLQEVGPPPKRWWQFWRN